MSLPGEPLTLRRAAIGVLLPGVLNEAGYIDEAKVAAAAVELLPRRPHYSGSRVDYGLGTEASRSCGVRAGRTCCVGAPKGEATVPGGSGALWPLRRLLRDIALLALVVIKMRLDNHNTMTERVGHVGDVYSPFRLHWFPAPLTAPGRRA